MTISLMALLIPMTIFTMVLTSIINTETDPDS